MDRDRIHFIIGFSFGGLILILVQWGVIVDNDKTGLILGFCFILFSLYFDICHQLKQIRNELKNKIVKKNKSTCSSE